MNLKGLILIAFMLGLSTSLVACTLSADDDQVCVGRRDKCGNSSTLDRQLPMPDNNDPTPGS